MKALVAVLVAAMLTALLVAPLAVEARQSDDDPDLPPGTVTAHGQFTGGKFLDPGEAAPVEGASFAYWEYELVDHDLVFWIFPSVDGQPTSVIGYGEVVQRFDWEMNHFVNDQPVTTRRAYTAFKELDLEGTWDGNDPGRIEGVVRWTVPEDRVVVERNEWTLGPVEPRTYGIYVGDGWTEGTFTATWSSATGVMEGELSTGPWDGSFEAAVIDQEPPAAGPAPGAPATGPCFLDVGPESAGCGNSVWPENSGINLLAALAVIGAPELLEPLNQRIARSESSLTEELPQWIRHTEAHGMIHLATLTERDGKPAFPVVNSVLPVLRRLAVAEANAYITNNTEERWRARQSTYFFSVLLLEWELRGDLLSATER